METTQTFGIQFLTRENRDIKSGLTFYARVTVNGSRVEISLKQNIASALWDSTKRTVKGNKTEVKELSQFFSITPDMSIQFESVLSIPARFWLKS